MAFKPNIILPTKTLTMNCKEKLELYLETKEKKYLHDIFKHCYRMLTIRAERKTGDSEAAIEIVSATFIAWFLYLTEKEDSFVDCSCSLAFRILDRKIIDWYRKQKKSKEDNTVEKYIDLNIIETEDYLE